VWGRGKGKLPRAPRRLGALPLAGNNFEKKSKKFFLEEPRENVWGPRENVSPGPAMALANSKYCYKLGLLLVPLKPVVCFDQETV